MKKYLLILFILLSTSFLFAIPEKVTAGGIVEKAGVVVEKLNGTPVNTYKCYDYDDLFSLVSSNTDTWQHVITIPSDTYVEEIFPLYVMIYEDNTDGYYYGLIYYNDKMKTTLMRAPL